MRGSIRPRTLHSGQIKYDCIVAVGTKRYWRCGGSNKREAEKLLAEMLVQLNNGTYVQPKKILFQDFAREWLDNYAFRGVKESTFRSYRGAINKHLCPKIGHFPIAQITPRIVHQLLSDLLAEKRSKKTVNNDLAILKIMFRSAIEWEYLRTNPAFHVKQLRVDNEESDFLQVHEVPLLLKHSDEPYRTLFLLAILTGLRRGEIMGLQWGDIDFVNDRIVIRRALYWLTKKEMDERKNPKRWVFIPPKTKGSRRSIVMSPELKTALEIHKINSPLNEFDLVFCNNKGNPLDPDNMVVRHFDEALQRAGLRQLRFYDLRHTYASLLMSHGFNIKFVQNQMGHTTSQMLLNRYAHLMQVDFKDAGIKIDQIFSASNGNLTESNATIT